MRQSKESRDFKKAQLFVERLLKIRLQSEKEIRDKLKKKQFSSSVIEQLVNTYKKTGLINDQKFTQIWLASRIRKPYGLRRVQFELKNKGINKDLIREECKKVFEHFPELEIVVKLARNRAKHYQNIPDDKREQRLFGYLSRRGFSQNIIYQALKQL